MFGKQTHDINSVAKEVNSVANAKWHELVDNLGSTEAARRATNAWDVLAGRPTPTRSWPMIRAAVFGAAVGWFAHQVYRRRQVEIDQAVDKAVDKVGHDLREAKHTIDDRIAKAKATPGSPMEKAKAAVSSNANSAPGAIK